MCIENIGCSSLAVSSFSFNLTASKQGFMVHVFRFFFAVVLGWMSEL